MMDSVSPQLALLQILLPSRKHVFQLVEFHEHYLLWYHGSSLGQTIRKEVEDIYKIQRGSIESDGINLQWISLLFAILSGSMTCAGRQTANSWGFAESEQANIKAVV
jgi:hypothetical protein